MYSSVAVCESCKSQHPQSLHAPWMIVSGSACVIDFAWQTTVSCSHELLSAGLRVNWLKFTRRSLLTEIAFSPSQTPFLFLLSLLKAPHLPIHNHQRHPNSTSAHNLNHLNHPLQPEPSSWLSSLQPPYQTPPPPVEPLVTPLATQEQDQPPPQPPTSTTPSRPQNPLHRPPHCAPRSHAPVRPPLSSTLELPVCRRLITGLL